LPSDAVNWRSVAPRCKRDVRGAGRTAIAGRASNDHDNHDRRDDDDRPNLDGVRQEGLRL
jgi:hypothetical protein